ncbi:protein kinase family protein [Thalassospira lucentensis]|uniref:protein kinase family protein n=1 Tax=Thalassospira lucentensis TaxID=168935 RepID=UPI003D2ECBB9
MAEQAEDQEQDVSKNAAQSPVMDAPGGGAPVVSEEPDEGDAASVEDELPGGNRSVEIGNFRVFMNLRLPEFDMGHCKAYSADNLRRDEGSAFAIVTDPALPTRYDLLKFLTGMHLAGQIDLLDSEIALWPPFGRKTMVLFYEKPKGGRVAAKVGKKKLPIDEHDISSVVVEPLMSVLQALGEKGLAHRNVRAGNLFFADPLGEKVVLGDCAGGPPGYNQPLVYETAARMSADPAGRGMGTLSDDLYALGMTLAELGIGHVPLNKLSDQEAMDLKLSKGSFQAIASQEKLPLVLIEPVRGLLCDDPEERWGFNELNAWIDGRRNKPVQTNTEKRAARSQNLAGRDYYTVRALAQGMAANWVTSLAPLRDSTIEIWLRRGLGDNERAKALSDAMRQLQWAGADKRSAEDVLIARAIIIMDPTGPVRFKGFSSMVDGFGYMLSYDVQHGRGPQRFADVVVRDVPSFWFGRQEGFSPEVQKLQQLYKNLRYYIQQQSAGYGYERCLYTSVRNQHCLSPMIEQEYVVEISQLLPALEKAAEEASEDTWPVDRHIAAFIATRLEDDVEGQLMAMQNPSDEVEYSRAIISMLAIVQWRHGPENLQNLSHWVARLMEPAIKVFHSKARRERVENEIPKLAKRGNLVELYNLINDEQERRKDQSEFVEAVAEYSEAESEVFDLESSGPARLELAEKVGQQAAAFASTMIALLTVSALFLMHIF